MLWLKLNCDESHVIFDLISHTMQEEFLDTAQLMS